MTAQVFYNRILNSKKDLLGEFLKTLHKNNLSYCVIGGVGINAYCEPLLTLDFDCVVIIKEVEKMKDELKKKAFKVKTHPYTWEITHKESDVRIQIQRDERYQEFIKRAESHKVLGYDLMVAHKKDILQGKIWAYEEKSRDELKREKDLLDIKRMVAKYPELKEVLTPEMKKVI
ncbi:hypothetical protein KKG61_08995 [bacterium]|nr:hypothetical protein [bacterium]